MNRFYLIILVALSLAACQKESFKIEGRITNAEGSFVYLEKLGISKTSPFDSTKIDKNGYFELKGNVSYPTFFLLKLNDQKFITLLIDSLEELTFSADYLNFSKDYHVEGSEGSEKVKLLNTKLIDTNSKIDSIKSLITYCINEEEYSEKKRNWLEELQDVEHEQIEFTKSFIEENPFSMASVLAIYQKFNNGNFVLQDVQTLKMAASALQAMHPRSDHAQALYRETAKLVQGISSLKSQQFIEEHGVDFPEIELPDLNGKTHVLSKLQGNTILLHFWSARNKSSRIQNEVLLENFNDFKNKGFTIYQVNVDTLRSAWETATREDRISWINVSDLEGCRGATGKYNVSQIPSNYLIDKSGKIVAKDLKGPGLRKALAEILNQ